MIWSSQDWSGWFRIRIDFAKKYESSQKWFFWSKNVKLWNSTLFVCSFEKINIGFRKYEIWSHVANIIWFILQHSWSHVTFLKWHHVTITWHISKSFMLFGQIKNAVNSEIGNFRGIEKFGKLTGFKIGQINQKSQVFLQFLITQSASEYYIKLLITIIAITFCEKAIVSKLRSRVSSIVGGNELNLSCFRFAYNWWSPIQLR